MREWRKGREEEWRKVGKTDGLTDGGRLRHHPQHLSFIPLPQSAIQEKSFKRGILFAVNIVKE